MCKYEQPKIMLIDTDKETTEKISEEGFNISEGSFGQKYEAQPEDECGLNGHLPYLTEKDIVIVDLKEQNDLLGENPKTNEKIINGHGRSFIVPRGQNYFDPSLLFAFQHKNDFEKILNNGGIIIVFCNSLNEEVYYYNDYRAGMIYDQGSFQLDNYSWLPFNSTITNCTKGKEIIIENNASDLANKLLKGSSDEIKYFCKFDIEFINNVQPIFRNPLDEIIGYFKAIENEDNLGFIFYLPQFLNKHKPIINLFEEYLPELKPDLFPEFVKNKWLDKEKYLFPKVKKVLNKKDKIILNFQKKIKEINEEISLAKNKYKFMTNILIAQGYGDFLEDNIYKLLKHLGYAEVVKVDEEIEGNRQEDFRIIIDNKFTVVEVKGHNSNPTEDDCQALNKYINRNMRRESRTDIHGILIVNHQKLLPPLKRKNPAFTPEQIDDAKRDGYTLVSTWELFKAVRLKQEEIINFNDINTSLHTPGLFKAIPSTFNYFGEIVKLYEGKTIACVYLELEEVCINDEILVQDGNNYFVQKIKEMRVDDKEAEKAMNGDALSIKLDKPISKQANIFLK